MVKIVAIRVQLKGDDAVLTTLGQTARGTRFRLKQEVVEGVKGPKVEYEAKLAAAIGRLAPRTSTQL